MLLIPEPFVDLITKLPGSLMFHLAILVCISATLYTVRILRRQRTINRSARISLGLSVLFLFQITLLFVDIASSSGYISDTFFVLLTNIAINCLSIIWLTWTWCSTRATKLSGYLLVGISILLFAFFAYTIISKINYLEVTPPNISQFITIWLLVGVILGLASVVIILVVKPANWGVAILLLTIISIGMIAQYFFSLNGSFQPFSLRVGSLFASILLPGVTKLLHPKYFSMPSGSNKDTQLDSKQLPVNFGKINNTAQDFETLVNQLQRRIDTLLLRLSDDDDITTLASLEATLTETRQLLQDTTSLNYLVSQWYSWVGLEENDHQSQSELIALTQKIYQSIFALRGYLDILSKSDLPTADLVRTHLIEEANYFVSEIASTSKICLTMLQKNQIGDGANTRLTSIHQALAGAIASVDGIIQQKNITLSLKIPDNLPDLAVSSKFLHFQLTRLLTSACQIAEIGSVISLTVTSEGLPYQQVTISFFVQNIQPSATPSDSLFPHEISHVDTIDEPAFNSQIENIKVAIAAVAGQLESHQTISGGLEIFLKFPID